MKRRRTFAGLLIMAAILGFAWHSGAQKPAPAVPDRERERQSFAINLVRAINAAEADYKSRHGSYADWTTLSGTGYFSETGTKWASPDFPTVGHAMYGRGPEIVPGWKLRLSVSNNGNAYDVLVEDVTDPKCRYAVLSDEHGTVRQAKSVDCPL